MPENAFNSQNEYLDTVSSVNDIMESLEVMLELIDKRGLKVSKSKEYFKYEWYLYLKRDSFDVYYANYFALIETNLYGPPLSISFDKIWLNSIDYSKIKQYDYEDNRQTIEFAIYRAEDAAALIVMFQDFLRPS